jgi:hypothetical protein
MNVHDWLLDSDPAINWQVMRDLTDEPEHVVSTERARVGTEGWGARLLSLQGDDGQWAGGAHFPGDFTWADVERGEDGRMTSQPWTATSWSLSLLRIFGLDPDSPEAKSAVALVRENSRWDHDGQRFFDGEVEPCINGLTVAVGSYFGEEVSGIVDRLLGEQMDDGGWNCEQENGSVRGSFHTTIAVLEGLLEYEWTVRSSPDVGEARSRGEQYLLERRLLRRLSDGEVVDRTWKRFHFPPWWHYDVLRGLDYLARAGVDPDDRVEEGLDLVEAGRRDDGRWTRSAHPGDIHFEIDEPEGRPSRWNTLRALRALRWGGRGESDSV